MKNVYPSVRVFAFHNWCVCVFKQLCMFMCVRVFKQLYMFMYVCVQTIVYVFMCACVLTIVKLCSEFVFCNNNFPNIINISSVFIVDHFVIFRMAGLLRCQVAAERCFKERHLLHSGSCSNSKSKAEVLAWKRSSKIYGLECRKFGEKYFIVFV